MSDTEGRVAVVADAALQEELIVQVEVGLREVPFQPAARLLIIRRGARRRVLQLEWLGREQDLSLNVDLAEVRLVQVLAHREGPLHLGAELTGAGGGQRMVERAIVELPALE